MKLSIVTINYNKSHLTIECMDSLYKYFAEELSNNEFELIVVDNASEKEELSFLKKEIKEKNHKNVTHLENDENYGFSKGCNIGAKKGKGEYILFLNNDTTVEDDGIKSMVEYMRENEEVSILGGQLTDPKGNKQSSTGKFYTLFNTILLLLGMQRFGITDRSPSKISEVDWVKGALFMVRKEVFDKLSGFDEKIFMYTEDMEFCYRAKEQGFKTFFYPDVSVIHKDQGSSNRNFAVVQIYKGILYFYKKHRSKSEYLIVKTVLYIKAIFALIIGYLSGNTYLKTTFRQAIQF